MASFPLVLQYIDTRHLNKELPTTKWRRERRIRMSTEYHTAPPSAGVKPLTESNSANSVSAAAGPVAAPVINGDMSPLDMSVSSATKPPPPPYREPLPGSQFAAHNHSHLASRPSVITQAPKREAMAANHENGRVPVVGKFCNGGFFFLQLYLFFLILPRTIGNG